MLSKARIIARIKKLYKQRKPLNIAAVKRHSPELLDSVYARKKYWGWKQALEDSGISYDEINTEILSYVTCHICGKDLCILGYHLRCAHETTSEEYLEEFPSSELVSEELRSSLTIHNPQTKRSLPHWEPIWSAEYVLDRLHAYYSQGYELNRLSCNKYELSLGTHAFKYFGGWNDALSKAGLDPEKIRKVNDKSAYRLPENTIAEIQRRHRENLPLNRISLNFDKQEKLRDQSLVLAGIRHFGSWAQALAAADIDPVSISKRYKEAPYTTRRAIIKEIKRRRRADLPLNHGTLSNGPPEERDNALLTNSTKLFGSWNEALEAAGLSKKAVAPPLRPHIAKRYSDIEAAKKQLLKIKKLSGLARYEWMMKLNKKYGQTIKKTAKYTSWKSLAKELNIPLQQCSFEKYIDKESVVDRLAQRKQKGLPNLRSTLCLKDVSLYKSIKKFYGGFDHPSIHPLIDVIGYQGPKFDTKAAVTREIIRRWQKKLPLNHGRLTNQPDSDADRALLRSGYKLFGSWNNALESADLTKEDVAPPTPPHIVAFHEEIDLIKKKLLEVAQLSGLARYRLMTKIHEEHGNTVQRSRYSSWKKLAKEMNVPHQKFSLTKYSDKESVVEGLALRLENTQSMRRKQIEKEDSGLYKAILKLYSGGFEDPAINPYMHPLPNGN